MASANHSNSDSPYQDAPKTVTVMTKGQIGCFAALLFFLAPVLFWYATGSLLFGLFITFAYFTLTGYVPASLRRAAAARGHRAAWAFWNVVGSWLSDVLFACILGAIVALAHGLYYQLATAALTPLVISFLGQSIYSVHGDRHNQHKIRNDAERAYLDMPTACGDSLDD